jgi:hypothetical protein
MVIPVKSRKTSYRCMPVKWLISKFIKAKPILWSPENPKLLMTVKVKSDL